MMRCASLEGIRLRECREVILGFKPESLICLLVIVLLTVLPVCSVGAKTPVIESPEEGTAMLGTTGSVVYFIAHDTTKDLELQFVHRKLKGLGSIPSLSTQVFLPAQITPFFDSNGVRKTAVTISIDDSLIGDLRLKVREKDPTSSWSEYRTIRILRSAADGIAELKAWPIYQEKILALQAKFLFYYSNQSKTVTAVFTDPQGTTVKHILQEYPQNIDTVNEFYLGIPFANMPREGTVRLTIETIETNEVSYELKLPDLEIVSINNLDNLEAGAPVQPFSITVRNSGQDATSVATEIRLQCTSQASNNPAIQPQCPPGVANYGIKFPVPPLASGETKELTVSPAFSSNWVTGKYLFEASIASTYHEVQETTYNDSTFQFVEVLPTGSQWQEPAKHVQIISPRENQVYFGSVTLEILQSHNHGQSPVNLSWSFLPEEETGGWSKPPIQMDVIAEVNDYRTVVPASAFPQKGKWHLLAYIKDPVSGGIMVDPDTHQSLQDTCVFTLQGIQQLVKKMPKFQQIEQKLPQPLQPQGAPENRLQINEDRLTGTQWPKESLALPAQPVEILSPRENQNFKTRQPVGITFRTSGEGRVIWQLQRRDFSGHTFRPDRKTMIRAVGGMSGSVGRAGLIGAEDGVYRFCFRVDGQNADWSDWRTITIGSPATLQEKMHPTQLRKQPVGVQQLPAAPSTNEQAPLEQLTRSEDGDMEIGTQPTPAFKTIQPSVQQNGMKGKTSRPTFSVPQ